MASPNLYPNGIGGASGATLATAAPLYASGNVWYVGPSGSDAGGSRGQDRLRPLATLAQAITNASAGDIIALLSSHTQTIGSSQTIGKAGLTIISEGTGSSRATFTRSFDGVMFDITAAGVRLVNVYFNDSTLTSTAARVKSASTSTLVSGCYFESGANDTGPALEFVTGAGQGRIYDTTFISVATSVASQPESAVKVTNAMSDLDMELVRFDGGSTGWSNQFAFNGAAAITRLQALNIDMLNDSDATMATGTTGFWVVRNKSGSARVVWTA